MNVNPITTATISINLNLQESITIRKSSAFLKRQETSSQINNSLQSYPPLCLHELCLTFRLSS